MIDTGFTIPRVTHQIYPAYGSAVKRNKQHNSRVRFKIASMTGKQLMLINN